jgi:hypothetical protein
MPKHQTDASNDTEPHKLRSIGCFEQNTEELKKNVCSCGVISTMLCTKSYTAPLSELVKVPKKSGNAFYYQNDGFYNWIMIHPKQEDENKCYSSASFSFTSTAANFVMVVFV